MAKDFVSLCGQRLPVFGGVYRLPFALDDACPNLRGGFALLRLFVGVEVLIDAGAAFGTVFARKAIEQAAVALGAVAMTIAGLLVERFLDLRRERVSILNHGITEEFGVHRRRKRTLRCLRMICRHRLVCSGLRRVRALRRLRSGWLGNKC